MHGALLSVLLCGLGGGASSSVSTTSPAVPQVASRYVFAPAGSTPKGTFGEPVTVTRASSKSCLVGGVWTTVASNVGCIGDAGLSVEGSRTQYALANCTAPADQTVTLAAGAHTLWLDGSGSVAVAVGTATATGLPCTATAAAACSFTVSVGGTVTLDVEGTVARMQVENGARSSLICATTTPVTRAADVVTGPHGIGSGPFCVVGDYVAAWGTAQSGLWRIGTGNPRVYAYVSATGNLALATVNAAGVGKTWFKAAGFSAGTPYRLKACYDPAGSARAFVNNIELTGLSTTGAGDGVVALASASIDLGFDGTFYTGGSLSNVVACNSPVPEECI